MLHASGESFAYGDAAFVNEHQTPWFWLVWLRDRFAVR
jgi:hypothetical protein